MASRLRMIPLPSHVHCPWRPQARPPARPRQCGYWAAAAGAAVARRARGVEALELWLRDSTVVMAVTNKGTAPQPRGAAARLGGAAGQGAACLPRPGERPEATWPFDASRRSLGTGSTSRGVGKAVVPWCVGAWCRWHAARSWLESRRPKGARGVARNCARPAFRCHGHCSVGVGMEQRVEEILLHGQGQLASKGA